MEVIVSFLTVMLIFITFLISVKNKSPGKSTETLKRKSRVWLFAFISLGNFST